VYVLGRFIYSFILLFKNLAILYEGACVLSITGLIGLFSLCVFMYALILGAVGFIFSRYLRLFFSIRSSHFCSLL
jgi:hypothetical protein